MRLSLLGPWLGATDYHLILRPSLVWSQQARLSRAYHSHAAWRQNLCLARCSCALGSYGTGHRSLQYPSRRFHSNQSAQEGGEPHAVSLAPTEAAAGFQARKLRARKLAEAQPPENAAVENAKSRHREPERSKTSDSKSKKLDSAHSAALRTRSRRQVKPAKSERDGNNDFVLTSSTFGQEGQRHFDYWAPAMVADAVHLEALLKARTTAWEAERKAHWAEKCAHAASVAKGSDDEKVAKRKEDFARKKAKRAALLAMQMETRAAEKGKAYETVRAELLAALETQPKYWEGRDSKVSQFLSGHTLRALIHSLCPICQGPHSLSACIAVFPDLGAGVKERGSVKVERSLFQDKLRLDKDVREAMLFITSKFQVSRGETREIMPLDRSATVDAPASAIS